MRSNIVLVTGGTGYLGSHTIINLHNNGYTPISIDNGINSDISTLEKITKVTGRDIKHYQVDLTDFNATKRVFEENEIDAIIHFAALKAVGESVEKPFLYFRNNLNSLINILELATTYEVKSFIFSSSCTVYGDVKQSPVTEETPLQDAASPYGRTKQVGEQIIQDALLNTDIKASILRYFNPAGAHPTAIIGESPINKAQNLVPVITETAIGKRSQMEVYGSDYNTRDGSCVRDYIHVMDLAEAHTKALQRTKQANSAQIETYNLGNGEGYTVLEVIKAFEEVSGKKLNYKIGPRRPGDVEAIYCNYQLAKSQLAWEPKYSLHDIVSSAWEWEKKRN